VTRPWGALAAVLVLCSCVGPARSFDAFEGKAADTADSVASAVETARLAVEVAAQGRVFAQDLSVVLAEAERDARGSLDIFASIQPPDPRSARLRTQLLDLIERAEAVLSNLRIAVRWGDLDRLPDIGRPLGSLGSELRDFSEAHS
jgi:hypothetical protein